MSAVKSILNLNITEPLKDENSYSTEFCETTSYKQIRISIESDCLLELYFNWSMDGLTSHIVDKWVCNANTWKSDLISIVMPYLQLRVEKKIPSANNRISVFVNPVSLNKATINQIPDVEPQEPKKKSKSPFFRRISEKADSKEAKTPKVHSIDYRLPTFIPSGAILVGGRTGQIEFLPRGLPGEILMMGERGPIWMDIDVLRGAQ